MLNFITASHAIVNIVIRLREISEYRHIFDKIIKK